MSNRLNKDTKIFSTSDLALAGALVAWNNKIVTINKLDQKRSIFLFEDTPELQFYIKAYWDESERILPKKYFYAIKDLKSQIYSEGR